MATNPMQRKARNSFLLGMLITTLIAAIIIGILLFQLTNMQKEQVGEEKKIKQVYTVVGDIKSGEILSMDNLRIATATTEIDTTKLLTPSDFESESNGEIVQKELIAKINLAAGTILTKEMATDSDNKINKDTRLVEYNMLVLPMKLEQGDYIDIRMTMPNGLDYIVISKKQIKDVNVDTIWINLSEDEIITMSNAIVESYITGSKLTAIAYVEPGNQTAAIPTYPISQAALNLINENSNIIQEAKAALVQRYKSNIRNNYVQPQIDSNAQEAQTNVETSMKEEIEKAKQNREQYFAEMEAAAYSLE